MPNAPCPTCTSGGLLHHKPRAKLRRTMSSRRAARCKRFLSMMGAACCGLCKAARAVDEKSYGHVALERLTQCLLKALPTFCLLWLLTPAWAQISPGALSRAHQPLTGATNCTTCHKFGSGATLKCVECHAEIGTRVAAHKGLHGTYSIPPGSSKRHRAERGITRSPAAVDERIGCKCSRAEGTRGDEEQTESKTESAAYRLR